MRDCNNKLYCVDRLILKEIGIGFAIFAMQSAIWSEHDSQMCLVIAHKRHENFEHVLQCYDKRAGFHVPWEVSCKFGAEGMHMHTS